MGDEPARYRFGPREAGGAVAGLSWGQMACVAAGLAAAVVALRADPGPTGALAGMVLAGLAGALALPTPGGRPPIAWAAVLTQFALRRIAGGLRFRAEAPTAGHARA